MKILIVDDEFLIRDFLSEVLQATGRYEAVTAENGSDAFEKCQNDGDIRLVISDLNMPVLDGHALIQKIRDAKMDLPIIVMSGNNEISIALNALNSGANDYLTKGENIQDLIVVAVDKALEKKQIQDENRRLLEKIMKQQALIESELKVATVVQKALLPSTDGFKNRPFDIYPFYRATVDVGGDFYDFMEYGENKTGFFIADVSGHGPSAAMIVAMLKALLLGEKKDLPPPNEMLRRLNKKLTSIIPDEHFVTAFFCVIDTAKGTISYSRAGHPAPFLKPKGGGGLKELGGEGAVLGMFEDEEFGLGSVQYLSGDRLYMYSDGIYEVRNKDELYGLPRYMDYLKNCTCPNGRDCVESVVKEVESFWDGESLRDDITLITVEFQ